MLKFDKIKNNILRGWCEKHLVYSSEMNAPLNFSFSPP
jgi:hypothetical protein